MPRIRTIKPEFPQSESMGNVSREARLTFIMLWTLADDEGRLRGNSRMLASLLFPYDTDAGDLIDNWLLELEKEGCIVRYKNGNDSYMQLCNWLIHQKIDKPSKSKIAPFDESSRILANPIRRIKDQGPEDQGAEETSPLVAESPEPAARPSGAVALSIAFRASGIATQPADPRLIALAEQGVGVETVEAACAEAKRAKPGEQIGLGYVMKILERWAADAAQVKVAGATAPKGGGSWWASDAASIAKGAEFGLSPRPGERMNDFQSRIRAAIDGPALAPAPAVQRAEPAPVQPKSIKPAGLDLKAMIGAPKVPA